MDASVPGLAANPALFTAINKDTAELHHELVPFNAELAQRMSDRAVRILRATDAGELAAAPCAGARSLRVPHVRLRQPLLEPAAMTDHHDDTPPAG